ncbi:hypothetical protein AALP_AA6G092800 [Arabis alpina]|uniref:Uncharacterized protein n=1 Tax=Arabis alpina TaxID=50452 RepID=A0A087GN34_ARAAL|nr:hypothetical protein AALP_AA6G092800 [Arabis alpina]
MCRTVRLLRGTWVIVPYGKWEFKRDPSDTGYGAYVRDDETFESLVEIVKNRCLIDAPTPLRLTYRKPELFANHVDNGGPPCDIKSDDEAALFMANHFNYPPLTLCVVVGAEASATYDFQRRSAFTVGNSTYLRESDTLEESLRNLADYNGMPASPTNAQANIASLDSPNFSSTGSSSETGLTGDYEAELDQALLVAAGRVQTLREPGRATTFVPQPVIHQGSVSETPSVPPTATCFAPPAALVVAPPGGPPVVSTTVPLVAPPTAPPAALVVSPLGGPPVVSTTVPLVAPPTAPPAAPRTENGSRLDLTLTCGPIPGSPNSNGFGATPYVQIDFDTSSEEDEDFGGL